MTKLMMILGLMFAGSVHADVIQLPKNTVALKSIAGELVKTAPLCPDGVRCVTNGTIVTLSFEVECSVKLLPLVYDGTGDLAVHAQVAAGPQQQFACLAFENIEQEITLVNVYPPFNIRFLGTGVVIPVKK